MEMAVPDQRQNPYPIWLKKCQSVLRVLMKVSWTTGCHQLDVGIICDLVCARSR